MNTPVVTRVRRDFRAMDRRRTRAARLFRAGHSQAEVARRLAVSRQSVSRWYRLYRQGGAAAMQGAGRAGRKPRLDRRQLNRLDAALRQGAQTHGFGTDLWTLPRVAQVIQRLTGVTYHPGHVWRILRGLNWTLQRPAKRARERNAKQVRQWIAERWPALKKKHGVSVPGSYSRTKAGSPSAPRSAAPGRQKAKRQS